MKQCTNTHRNLVTQIPSTINISVISVVQLTEDPSLDNYNTHVCVCPCVHVCVCACYTSDSESGSIRIGPGGGDHKSSRLSSDDSCVSL